MKVLECGTWRIFWTDPHRNSIFWEAMTRWWYSSVEGTDHIFPWVLYSRACIFVNFIQKEPFSSQRNKTLDEFTDAMAAEIQGIHRTIQRLSGVGRIIQFYELSDQGWLSYFFRPLNGNQTGIPIYFIDAFSDNFRWCFRVITVVLWKERVYNSLIFSNIQKCRLEPTFLGENCSF